MRRSLRILPLAWAGSRSHGERAGRMERLRVVHWDISSTGCRRVRLPAISGTIWSLAVEEQFYLVWPAIVFFSSSRTLWRATLAIFAIDVAFRFAVSMWPPPFVTRSRGPRDLRARRHAGGGGAPCTAGTQRRMGTRDAWALPVCLVAGAALVSIYKLETVRTMATAHLQHQVAVDCAGRLGRPAVCAHATAARAHMGVVGVDRTGQLRHLHHPRVIRRLAALTIHAGAGAADLRAAARR